MTDYPNDFHLRMLMVGDVGRDDLDRIEQLRREFIGTTFVPLGQQWSAAIRVPPEDPRNGMMDHIRKRIVRRLHDLTASHGFSTTENLIYLHMEERPPEDIYIGVTTWLFPRAYPTVGDPARVDGGVHHGDTFLVESTLWNEVRLMDEFRYPHIYRLAGFDVGTGQWIYRGAR